MQFRWMMMLFLLVALPAWAQDDVGGAAADAAGAELNGEAVQDPAEFSRELQTVEEKVSHLKERVFASKATLQLLKELVIDGATVGAKLAVWHVNRLGGGYTMEAAQYFLNGKSVWSKVDPGGSLDNIPEVKILEQTVTPGKHSLQVHLVLRGKGYRIFSYLRTYQFKVQSTFSFKAEDGKLTQVRVLADRRGGFCNFVDCPDIRFDPRVESLREE
jgi:hypothetical protein